MEKEELFINFLNLAALYFREESNADFYAGQLEVTVDELSDTMLELSGWTPSEWIKEMQRGA
ncbi:MAG: hypothetical protein LBQ60_13420 [Bacteroidales bacterium]|jgi:hypothetical protein|nr:hypothetical protein [Bacteroidales bacterium]